MAINASAFTDDALAMWADKRTRRFLDPETVVNVPDPTGESEGTQITYRVRVSGIVEMELGGLLIRRIGSCV